MRYDSKGFTLIELLIVVVIIGIPGGHRRSEFGNGKERAMVTSMKGDLHNLVSAEEAYYSNGQTYYNGAVPAPRCRSIPRRGDDHAEPVSAPGWAPLPLTSSPAASRRSSSGTAAPAPATVEGQLRARRNAGVADPGRPGSSEQLGIGTQADVPLKPKGVSLRTALAGGAGFRHLAAVVLVGLTTLLITGNDLARDSGAAAGALAGQHDGLRRSSASTLCTGWSSGPLQRLTAEADALATGQFPAARGLGNRRVGAAGGAVSRDGGEFAGRAEPGGPGGEAGGIGRLAAGVAHEVRNPLGALGTYVEVLQRRGTDPKVTGDMRQAIDRIERIVQGLVDYARPGAKRPPLSAPPTTDLNAAVRTVTGLPGSSGTFRDHAVETPAGPDLPLVPGDQHLLEQVIVNLVVNACQATPGGRVVVGTLPKALVSQRRTASRSDDGEGTSRTPSAPGCRSRGLVSCYRELPV